MGRQVCVCVCVCTLNHKVGYDPMKETSTITESLFVGTKCNEILHRFWYSFTKQTNLNASDGLITNCYVKEHLHKYVHI